MENITLTKEEEEGVMVASDEVSREEIFQRTLAKKLWRKNSFNKRAFTNTIVGARSLKNPVET